MAETSSGLETARLTVDLQISNYLIGLFVTRASGEGLSALYGEWWVTDAGIDAVPGEVVGSQELGREGVERIVRLGDTLCHVFLHDQALTVAAAAPDRAAAVDAIAMIRGQLPELIAADREIPVEFWWWTPRGEQRVARTIDAPAWSELMTSYAASTRGSLIEVAGWTGGPPARGRLMLWHGPPGTGKTTALRSLAGEWREWADLQFVSDPEAFLGNPAYMFATIAGRRSRPRHRVDERWRVIVLEDAGEYLVEDARQTAGQALSRLLNLTDGVLGQSMRALVLITTNEPVELLHPALTRPGRCLAEIDFQLLERAEIVAWCGARGIAPPPGRQASLADLHAHVAGRAVPRRERRVGFAPPAA